MNTRTLARLKNHYTEVKCRTCGKEIVVGDKVVTCTYANRHKIRHETCYEKCLKQL